MKNSILKRRLYDFSSFNSLKELKVTLMHEYNVTKEILDIVLDKIKEYDCPSVRVINIILGKLTSFVPDSIEYYFPFVSKGTPAEHAKLHFKQNNIVFLCNTCKKKFEEDDMVFFCPRCKGDDLEIVSGKEFFIESIEVKNGKN